MVKTLYRNALFARASMGTDQSSYPYPSTSDRGATGFESLMRLDKTTPLAYTTSGQ